ncbi:MAG: hypothetical protein H7067_13820 [Burkholderiales bacterium]|nr:hypothetical protein [Opitutaceae bacterium]
MPATDHTRVGMGRWAVRAFLLGALAFVLSPGAHAYPPAPPHTIYGVVRDRYGNPYESTAISVILFGGDSLEKARTTLDPLFGLGVNYSLDVAMDAGLTSTLYEPTAMRPTLPFTMRVLINGVSYLPIQLTTGTWTMGQPAQRRRIDLTVGVDSDGDGIPDDWEYELIASDASGRFSTLADIRPGDDFDGDGLSNFAEYIAGSYAFDSADALALSIVQIVNGSARLQFLAIKGRAYTLTASTDLVTWTPQPFALAPGGVAAEAYTATDVRVLDVYAPMGAGARKFFRLHVQ